MSRAPSQRADCFVPWAMPTTEWIAYAAGVVGRRAGLDRPVEVVQGGAARAAVDAGQRSPVSATRCVAVAEVDARVDRQQLVHGRQRAQQRREVGELQRAELLDEAVDEEVDAR